MYSLRRSIIFIVFAALCVLPLSRTAQAADVTTIVSGLNGAYGSDYDIDLNSSFFVERYTGNIWRINMNNHVSAAVGSGYTEPMDIVLSSDGTHAYVIENGGGGTLLHVSLASLNRAGATVVATGLGGILGQLALDEDHGYAYVVQNSGFGGLWRVNLATGAKTLLVDVFDTNPSGLLLSSDSSFAYYTELGFSGKVKRVDLVSGGVETLATGLTNPSYLAWADPGEGSILVAESGAGRISSIDLTASPAVVQEVVSGLPNVNTRSVTVITESRLLVSVHVSMVEVNLTSYSSSGPILLGIGHVPFDRIFSGYADTTGDPGYFFQVKDAPFGGTLSLMINHDGAYKKPNRARWYQVLVDGVEQQGSWSDYRWNSGLGHFVLETISPKLSRGHYYYPVRKPGEIWYNHWLGYRLNTTGLSNGLHTISIKLFKGRRKPRRQVGSDTDTGRFVNVMIDNRRPTAVIDQILHYGVPVDTCAIVEDDCKSDEFTFRITASDPDAHLKSWRLVALWGDNRSALIDSDSYAAHLPGPLWSGITNAVVPTPAWHAVVPGDPTSWNCAHTFILWVWDRAINGYNHIHRTRYHKSITIMLSCPLPR